MLPGVRIAFSHHRDALQEGVDSEELEIPDDRALVFLGCDGMGYAIQSMGAVPEDTADQQRPRSKPAIDSVLSLLCHPVGSFASEPREI